jgi:hypothetical protein
MGSKTSDDVTAGLKDAWLVHELERTPVSAVLGKSAFDKAWDIRSDSPYCERHSNKILVLLK